MMPAPIYSCTRPLRLALLGRPDAAFQLLAHALADTASGSGWHVHIETPSHTPALQADLTGFDLVLLAGLESVGHHSTDAAHEAAQQAEQALRTALAGAGVSYQVLYGTPPERLARALHALEALLAVSAPAARPVGAGSASLAGWPKPRPQPWVWSCDKCSDPQCEYRLLTDLLASRTRPANSFSTTRRAWAA
ncbi:MAG: hypothetical protein ACWA6Y_08325 [Polaromonas sp.]